jgi:hypothetical protein
MAFPAHIHTMATIYNSDLTKELREGAKLQTSTDSIPSQLAEKVVPVMEVNPKLLKSCNIIRHVNNAASGSNTIYTTPTDRDFYLVTAWLSYTKNVTCDITTGAVAITAQAEEGSAFTILGLANFTLAVESDSGQISFPTPVKLKRGTAITMSGTFTAGAMSRSGGITGYTIDNIQA